MKTKLLLPNHRGCVCAAAAMTLSLGLLAGVPTAGFAKNYYVNDASTNYDVYCTAVGSDANPGTNAAAPKLTVTNLLAVHTLAAGDVVYIDTGYYSNYTVTVNTPGAVGNPITFQGSTNYGKGVTVFSRNNSASNVFALISASYVNLRDLTVKDGRAGVYYSSGGNSECYRVTAFRNGRGFDGFLVSNVRLTRCAGVENSTGIQSFNTTIAWDQGLMWSNSVAFGLHVPTSVSVSNSIIVGGQAYDRLPAAAEYNVYWNALLCSDTVEPARFLSEMQGRKGHSYRSIVADPLLADPVNGDFHPRSVTARFNPATGFPVTDLVHSAAIDFGDPSRAFAAEPSPNGSRMNAGVFGDTAEASRSRTNAWLLAISYNDGGPLYQTGRLYWAFGNIATTETVRLEYSRDNKATWLAAVTNVAVTNVYYTWNASAVTSSPLAYWRVVRESDTNLWDACDTNFSLLGTGPIRLYVNDVFTPADVYTTAAGAPGNDGRSPSTPKDTLQGIVDAYALSGEFVVYVDSGSYTGQTTTLTVLDAGASNRYLVIQGSTNSAAGGTVIDRRDAGQDVLVLNGSSWVQARDLTLRGGRYGAWMNSSDYNAFERVTARNNQSGFQGNSASYQVFTRCVAYSNTYGANGFTSGILWNHGVSWGNGSAFLPTTPSQWSVSNSAIVGGTAFDGPAVPGAGDYNLFWNTTIHASFPNLAALQKGTNGWWQCVVADPLFANPGLADFHPRSVTGTYSNGTWASYTNHSPLIDLGDTNSPYASEPWPNGTNVNIGRYGNTAEASKSRTNAWLMALTYNDGGTLNAQVADRIYWRAGNLPAGARVRIELSRDLGDSWEIVETNLLASAGSYAWANTNFASSRYAYWRVVYEASTNVLGATSATNFSFQNGPYYYYINDDNPAGDVYCTAIGNDENLGTSKGSPKYSLKSLFDTHEIQAGDIVFVDTGVYDYSDDQTIGAVDSGASNAYILVQGSTNTAAGGSVINRRAGTVGLYLNGATYYDLRHLTVTNAGAGIRLVGSTGTRLTYVVARGNQTGFDIQGSAGVILDRSVSAENTTAGLQVSGAGSVVQFRNGVHWRNGVIGVRADSGRVILSNSVVAAYSPTSYVYYAATPTNIWGNYNALHAESNALAGFIVSLGRNLDTLDAWTAETGQEIRSLQADPLFADPANGDFHPQTEQRDGRWIPGVGWNPGWDTVTSPLIDSGDPAGSFTNETLYNGARVNIGLYGDTVEASKRSSNAWLYAASLRQGGWVRGTSTLHWVAGGAATGHLVKVEFSANGGRSWATLTNNAPAAAETFAWNTWASGNTPAGLWRVSSVTDPAITDQPTNFFSVRNAALTVYLNDGNTNGDVYCSAPGAATNWEATAAAPLSVPEALTRFNLEPGDLVLVDTGIYTNQADVALRRRHSGSEASPVRVLGSTNDAAGGSVWVRGGAGAARQGLSLEQVQWMAVSNLVLQGAHTGLRLERCMNVFFTGLRSEGQGSNGVEVLSSTNIAFLHSAAHRNSGQGLLAQSSLGTRWLQSVIWSNRAGGARLVAGETLITNSVLQASGSGATVYLLVSNALLRSDYNDVLAQNAANVGVAGFATARDMSRWAEISTNDLRSLTHAPLFADAEAGNFRPASTAGRFNPVTRAHDIFDGQTSPLLDAGVPGWAFAQEPPENGRRVNIGMYGNHPQASLSPTNGWLLALTMNDGGSIRGTNNIYWLAGGAATGHLLTVQFSWDGGGQWTNVATNVQASAGVLAWATDLMPSTPRGVLRYISEADGSITVTSAVLFTVNNDPLTYYINDSSTNGDVYCLSTGSVTNDGVSANAPLDSLNTLLSRYYLKEGDRVLVDTGVYTTPNAVEIGATIVGTATNQVLFQGSTNEAAGGTVLDFQDGDVGVRVEQTANIVLRDLTIRRAGTGLFFLLATNCVAEWIRVEGGGHAYEVEASRGVRLDHSIAMNASTSGLHNVRSTNTVWQNGVLWSNRFEVLLAAQHRVSGLTTPPPDNRVTISNSVLGVWRTNGVGYYIQSGALVADYNDIYVPAGGAVATRSSYPYDDRYGSVARWVAAVTQDLHSLSHEPGFYSAETGDFYLKSPAGRYDPAVKGFVTTDTETSPLIDAGWPLAAFTNEPTPNGSRVNIGLHANSSKASKTPSAGTLRVISFNDGGIASGAAVPLRWIAGGDATGHTVRVDFSVNGGSNWQTLATGLAASSGEYSWNSLGSTSTLSGVWKVTSVLVPSLSAQNAVFFGLRNTNFTFYVNDDSRDGDVYTEAVGSNSVSGRSADLPRRTVQSVLDDYDLEAGDTIFIDTGVYTGNQASVLIGTDDGGLRGEALRVTLQGSTNSAAGGTRLELGGELYGVRVRETAGVALRDMALTGVLSNSVLLERTQGVDIQRVTARGGVLGFVVGASYDATLRNCAASEMSSVGLLNGNSSNVLWQGGVLWSNRTAVLLATWAGSTTPNGLTVSNSILAAYGAGSYVYSGDDTKLRADCNDIYLHGGARAALRPTTWISEIVETVSRWVWLTGLDANSLSHDPRFADPAAGDFHLRSQGGRWAVTNYVYTDTNTSVAIDAGGVSDDFSLEPDPNGARRNIGLYGNTTQASLTPTNARLTVISLNDGGRAQGTAQPLYWLAGGAATGHTVKVSFSADGGATWSVLSTGLAASVGVYYWNTTLQPSTMLGAWELRSETDTNLWVRSERVFAVRNEPLKFYVNDFSTNGDVYATAPGNPTNLGLFAHAPKTSVQDLLDTWDIEAGDTVYVDTGVYTSQAGLVVGQLDAGSYSNSLTVVIQGSTNEQAGGTVWVGEGGTNGVHLFETDAVEIRNLTLRGYLTGVRLTSARRCAAEWVRVEEGVTGFQVTLSAEARFEHCVARGMTGAGLNVAAPGVAWRGGVLWSNVVGVSLANGSLSLSDSVIGVIGTNRYAYSYDPQAGLVTANYNNVYLTGGGYAALLSASPLPIVHESVSRWARASGQDRASLSHDPLFVNAAAGDFHLKSEAGRYDSILTNWFSDGETSPLVDAGDPSSAWTNETAPNGRRRNIGLYGHSPEASRTPTGAVLTAVSLNDGGRVEGVFPLVWVARGAATGHTVRLEYSANAGASWNVIASNVSASAGVYYWDSQSYTSSIRGVWGLWSEQNTNVFDRSDALFALRNERLRFYVNDASTNGDIYATAPGNAANDGTAAFMPALTIQSVVDAWDLEPGDTIYVDTGEYRLSTVTTIGRGDAWDGTNLQALASGIATNFLTIQGSTNEQAGGTLLLRFEEGDLLSLDSAPGVWLRDLTLRGGAVGVRAYKAHYGQADWVRVESGGSGFDLEQTDYFALRHCVSRGNTDKGLSLYTVRGVSWRSGVIWSNKVGTYLEADVGVHGLTVENSIIGAFGEGAFAHVIKQGSISSDYNNIYLTEGAMAGGQSTGLRTTRYESVFNWGAFTRSESRTLTEDPKFADAGRGDFHLRTTRPGGRYDPLLGVWTNDNDFSRLIDAGNPASASFNEPTPGAARINIGLYGNTWQASRTPTNAWLTLITLNDGGSVQGTQTLYWVAGGAAGGHQVYIDYNRLSGLNFWTNIVTNLTGSSGTFVWDLSALERTAAGEWRINSAADPDMVVTSKVPFTLRDAAGSIWYFVNDSLTNGDVYTTAPGQSSLRGTTPYWPKSSIQDVLNTYKLEPWDIIFVDTGEYKLTADIRVDDLDSGSGTNRVTIQGSTNWAAGGTVINRQVSAAGTAAIRLDLASGINLRDLTLKGAESGLAINRTEDCTFDNVRSIENGARGYSVVESLSLDFYRCTGWKNGGTNGVGILSEKSSLRWFNGVLWGNAFAVQLLNAGTHEWRNSAFQAIGYGSRIFQFDLVSSVSSLTSDYNNFQLSSGAILAEKAQVVGGDEFYGTLLDWQREAGKDANSLSHEPQFADANSGDFSLKSTAGRYRADGSLTNDTVHSPMIDTGDPSSVWTNEPSPNGSRINAGIRGNSSRASLSVTNPWLLAVSINAGGIVRGTGDLVWASGNLGTGALVRLEYSRNNGAEWLLISSNIVNGTGRYTWDVSAQPVTVQGRWRVIYQANTNVWDACDSAFVIKNGTLTIYVNDASTNRDVYCRAPGSPANSGLTNSAPLHNPVFAMTLYPITAGDTLYIDTGDYTITTNMLLGELNRGYDGTPIRILGSTNGSLISRDNNFRSGLIMNNTRHVEVSDLKFTTAGEGVELQGVANISFRRVQSYKNRTGLLGSTLQAVSFDQCAFWSNRAWGFTLSGLGAASVNRSVFSENKAGAIQLSVASLGLSNSIVYGKGTSVLYSVNQAGVSADYNVLWNAESAQLARDENGQFSHANLQSWQRLMLADVHSVRVDPLFYNSGSGDFHLQSQRGRWFTTNWVNDAQTSWAIDAASPAAPFISEPSPNGGRMNAGLDGNTGEASKSVTNAADRALYVASLDDGGLVTGTKELYWLSRGLSSSDYVRIEFSPDNGGSWSVVATNIPATQAGYFWDATTVPSTPLGRWKILLQSNTNINDATASSFILRNGPIYFYVNDQVTNGDVYCHAPGVSTNTGLSAFFPKASLEDVLVYDLEGGDVIYMDTGFYPISNTVAFTRIQSGVSTSRVQIVGGTNAFGPTAILAGTFTNFTLGVGIKFTGASYIELRNLVFTNLNTAIRAELFSTGNEFRDLRIRDGGDAGITLVLSSDTRIENTVITRMAGTALQLESSGGTIVEGCVLWSNRSAAVVCMQGGLAMSNSILYASGPTNFCVVISTGSLFRANYNNYYLANDAGLGTYQGVVYDRLLQWGQATLQDYHSLSIDPAFADPGADDYHVRSLAGRRVPGYGWTNDAVHSPMIDTGAPDSPFVLETEPNGARRNIGLYGGRAEASRSLTNEWLMVLAGSSGGRGEGLILLTWAGRAATPTNQVQLDYSYDNGTHWLPIAQNIPLTDGSYIWNSSSWPISPIARWRLTLESNTNVWDITDHPFAINGPFNFYLNDTNPVGDIYTSALGSDTNLGIYSTIPKLTLRNLLDSYDLEGGDTIWMDTGIYDVTTNDLVRWSSADQGARGLMVELRGATNALVTVLRNISIDSELITIAAAHVNLHDLVVQDGDFTVSGGGLRLYNVAVTNGDVILAGNGQTGSVLRVENGNVTASGLRNELNALTVSQGAVVLAGTNLLLRNSLVIGSASPAVSLAGGAITILNNTLAGSGTQIRKTGGGNAVLENNIVVADGLDRFCLQWDEGTVQADYNNYVVRNGAWIGNRFGWWEKLLYWQRASEQDTHSLALEPRFADEAAGDYHLKSATGRWSASGWTNDAVYSPCIDVGNPLTVSWTNESAPNGYRVNMGAYGGTAQASQSPPGAQLFALTASDGGVLKGTNVLRWTSVNLGPGDLVRIEYSTNGFASSQVVVAGLSAAEQQYTWDTTLVPSSLFAAWRVVLETNTAVEGRTEQYFAVRNTPLPFYVNDSNTLNDVYTSQRGSDTNNGLSAATPMASLKTLLDTYDTEGGDTIYVDTGFYTNSGNIRVVWSRGGEAGYGAVTIQGSTNYTTGGSVLIRAGAVSGIGLDVKASYLALRDLALHRNNFGVLFETSAVVRAERLMLASNNYGLVARGVVDLAVRNARFWDNRQAGFQLIGVRTALVEHCTLVGSTNVGGYVEETVDGRFQNSIFSLDASNAVAFSFAGSNVMESAFVDYNVYHFEKGGFVVDSYSNLTTWQLLEGKDLRSAFTNPLMAQAAAGDFHLRSAAGRWVDGFGWTNDLETSWAIDKANPASLWTNEPSPHGARANIGAYGNTEYASKGSNAPEVLVRSPNQSLFIGDTNSILPLIWHVRNLPTGQLVAVQYSGDGGASWSVISNNVPAYQEYIVWQATPFYNTFGGYWRVVGISDTNYWDVSDVPFGIFLGEFAFSRELRPADYNRVIWRGAWNADYQVQVATNVSLTTNILAQIYTNMVGTNEVVRTNAWREIVVHWTNAPSGTGVYQQAHFISTVGGDLYYDDPESTNRRYRLYRVIQQ